MFRRNRPGSGSAEAITYLACHGPLRTAELAEYFEVDSAAVSRMVDSFEKGRFYHQAAQRGEPAVQFHRADGKRGIALMKPGGSDAVKWRKFYA